MWWTKYIGLPFEEQGRGPGGYDCWGLVRLVYEKELGMLLPSWAADHRDESFDTANSRFLGALPQFEKLQKPEPFIMALFNSSSHVFHIGVLISEKRMLHTVKGIGACVQDLSSFKNQLKGFYRPHDQSHCQG